jgi:hypothetical protein
MHYKGWIIQELFNIYYKKDWKVYGHHDDLVNRYGIAVLQMTTNMLCLLFMTIAGLVARVTHKYPFDGKIEIISFVVKYRS